MSHDERKLGLAARVGTGVRWHVELTGIWTQQYEDNRNKHQLFVSHRTWRHLQAKRRLQHVTLESTTSTAVVPPRLMSTCFLFSTPWPMSQAGENNACPCKRLPKWRRLHSSVVAVPWLRKEVRACLFLHESSYSQNIGLRQTGNSTFQTQKASGNASHSTAMCRTTLMPDTDSWRRHSCIETLISPSVCLRIDCAHQYVFSTIGTSQTCLTDLIGAQQAWASVGIGKGRLLIQGRFNYILFAQRLLDSTQDNHNDKYDPNRRVIGLDMWVLHH